MPLVPAVPCCSVALVAGAGGVVEVLADEDTEVDEVDEHAEVRERHTAPAAAKSGIVPSLRRVNTRPRIQQSRATRTC